MADTVISAHGLRKVYRSITALDGIDLESSPASSLLLGPNGAGKTTTVKILLGLTHPTAGGLDPRDSVSDPASRRRVGYLPEGHRFPGYLTARQTLSVFGRMSGMAAADLARRVPELLARVNLEKWADVRVRKFSKGMVQRLGLASALVHDPDVLLLDEPTDGVDPVGRREIRDLLQEEARRGKAVLVNSHLLSEIELTCSRVAILRAGRIAAEGTIDDLTRREARYKMVAAPVDDKLLASFRDTGAGVEGRTAISPRGARLDHVNALVDGCARRAGTSSSSPLKSSRRRLRRLFRPPDADSTVSARIAVGNRPRARRAQDRGPECRTGGREAAGQGPERPGQRSGQRMLAAQVQDVFRAPAGRSSRTSSCRRSSS
jgi:ABC-2 type transport system ATP-binding protein